MQAGSGARRGKEMQGSPPLVIEAGRAGRHYWRNLWTYRELFTFLAWRDILVRYKQTALGVIWAPIRPILTILVFTVVFGKLAGLPSDGVPYPILVGAAILPWQFFSSAFSDAGNSLIVNSSGVSKAYLRGQDLWFLAVKAKCQVVAKVETPCIVPRTF